MDYSKKGGGTRIHDQLKARTLATGHGQTYRAARENGSHRAQKVVEAIKPGQLVHDRGLDQMKTKRDDETAAMLGMEPPPFGPDVVPDKDKWPLTTGSKSHEQTTGQLDRPASRSDQGEHTRVATTGRRAHQVKFQNPLGKGR